MQLNIWQMMRMLDPFCGTATLLIERYRRKKAAHLYGVDIFGEAIDGARENAGLANVPSYFINKDFAEFSIAIPLMKYYRTAGGK